MKVLLFIVLAFFSLNNFSQNHYALLIDGHVFDNDKKKPVIAAEIILKTALGDELLECTDTNGYYSFTFSKTAFQQATITIQSSRWTHAASEKCRCYLGSRESGIIQVDSSKPKHVIKDFELFKASHCCEPYIPRILFKNQSLIYDTISSSQYFNKEDSLLDIPPNGLIQFTKFLKENPTLIIQISGHCSFNEKNSQELSQQRAEKVKLDLVKLGIEPERIVTKGFGDSRLMIKPEILKREKTQEEKEILHSRNRRGAISILSSDYGKTPDQIKKENEE